MLGFSKSLDYNLMASKICILIIVSYFETSTANLTDFTSHPNFYLFPQPPECGVTTLLEEKSAVGARIVGGTAARLGEFPWLVPTLTIFQLKYPLLASRPVKSNCGGAIINNRYILTAAHCADKENKGLPRLSATVFVGEWNKSSDPDQQGHLTAPPRLEIEVEEIIRHPDFVEDPSINISSQNDIALFRLKHPLAFNDFIKPICLPFTFEAEQDRYVSSRVIEAGWGKYGNGKVDPPVLQKATATIVAWETCHQDHIDLSKAQVCVKASPYHRPCGGDSGTPLMYNKNLHEPIENTVHYVLGVHSWGRRKCEEHDKETRFSGNVWVPSFIKWILDNVRK